MDKNLIKPFHLFIHKDNQCVINIKEMHAYSVDKVTAEALKKIDTDLAVETNLVEKLKKLNLISTDENQVKKHVKKEPTSIVNMALFLTQSCNLNCIYCYGGGGEYGTGGSLDVRTAYQAVDWLIKQSRKVKKIRIGFFGGEPFLNFPVLKKVVEYAKKRAQEVDKKVSFYVTTNGTLLDEEKICFIKKHNIAVQISFDGPKQIQDVQRPFTNGTGSYDSTVPKIKNLLKVLPKTHGHAVLVGNTNPQQVKDALKDIGFVKASLTPASESLFDWEAGKRKENRNLDRIMKEIEHESETWLRHIKDRDVKSLENLISNGQLYQGLLSFLHNRKNHYPCGAGLGLVGVSCAGDIYLCHRFVGMEEYKMGNVFNDNLDRDKYQKSPITYVKKCSKCPARYYCSGGCKHDHVGSYGSVLKPSNDMCQLRCHEIELAAYISCMLNDEDRAFLIEFEIFPPKPCPLDFT